MLSRNISITLAFSILSLSLFLQPCTPIFRLSTARFCNDCYAPPLDGMEPPLPFGYRISNLSQPAVPLQPISGPEATIVICVEFADVYHSKEQSEIHNIVFKRMNDYYREVSFGSTFIVGNTTRWYRVDNSMSYYGTDGLSIDDPNRDGYPDSWRLIHDAVRLADGDVNFKQYSHVIVVHAGNGEESSRVNSDIWSVYYEELSISTNDGVTITHASLMPESEVGADVLGVYVHEFGHELGLPDLYDVTYRQDFVGRWCLMGMGTWNGKPPGSSPAHLLAWCKIKLGWIKTSSIKRVDSNSFANLTLNPIENSAPGYYAIKMPLAGGNYYLAEVRQKVGFDSSLPSSGLLVTQIDEGLSSGYGIVRVKDANPSYTLDDAAFQVQQTFRDKDNNVAVSVLSAGSLSLVVNVERRPPAPDLTVANVGLDPSTPRVGETVTFSAEVKNMGTATADSFRVSCYLDGKRLSTTVFSLDEGASATMRVTWNATSGSHLVKFAVDELSSLELSKDNNEASLRFIVGFLLTVKTPYTNFWVKVNGTSYEANVNGRIQTSILAGSYKIEVQTPVSTPKGVRGMFVKWDDGETQNPRFVNIGSDLTLTALYKTQYYLAVEANGGIVSGEGWYDAGSSAIVTASSPCKVIDGKSRHVFTRWSGDLTNSSTTLTIAMNSPHAVTSNGKVQYYLKVSSRYGNARGEGWYDAGSTASFSIDALIDCGNGSRRVFLGWIGNATAKEVESSVLMNSPKMVMGNWKTQHKVSFSSIGLPNGVSLTTIVNQSSHSGVTPFQHSDWFDEGESLSVGISPSKLAITEIDFSFINWRNSGGQTVNFPQNVSGTQAFTAVFNPTGGCFISLATYGSELSSEAQYLRNFRDQKVLKTFAGYQFMAAFNRVYYQLSPFVSRAILENPVLRLGVKFALYPLLAALHIGSVTYASLSFNPELAVVVAGFMATSLIGIIYVTPPLLFLLLIRRLLQAPMPKTSSVLKVLGIPWTASLALVLIGEGLVSPSIFAVGAAAFVFFTFLLSSIGVAVRIAQPPRAGLV